MNRDQALQELKQSQDALKARGVTALHLYGSTCRNEAKEDSDIDVFIEFDATSNFSLVDLSAIQRILSEKMKKSIHITSKDALNPLIKDSIQSEAIKVFDGKASTTCSCRHIGFYYSYRKSC
jgi:uncharacterized protein